MKKVLFLLCSTALMLSACTDSEVLTSGEGAEDNEALYLTDANGAIINTVNGQCGDYYAHIRANGAWTLSSDAAYIVPVTTSGEGNAVVKVIVGNNWQGPRQGQLVLSESSATRAGGASITRATLSQASNAGMDDISNLFSSNKGAGYSYMPNENYCLGTNMEVFNMGQLKTIESDSEVDLVTDDLYPSTVEQVITSETEQGLHDKLAISASLSIDLKKIAIKVSGHYDNTSDSDASCSYGMSRMKSYYFTREVNYMNIVTLAEEQPELRDRLYAPGFRRYLNDFITKVNAAGNSTADTDPICKEFLQIAGPCFISKAVMGSTLDYEIAIKRDSLKNGLTIGGALNVSFMYNGVKVAIDGSGDFQKYSTTVQNSTEAKAVIRGGNVNLINILATGGKVDTEQFIKWQQSVEPRNCVMVDMTLVPIYAIIFDTKAHDVLKAYFEKILTSEE